MLHSAKSKSINEAGLDLHQHEGEQNSGFKKRKESRKSYINVIGVKERSCFFSGEE